jgi:hydroxymethylbilane synthase
MSEGKQQLVVGTRGSELALVQAEMVETLLRAACPGVDITRRVIRTTGDRRTDVPLSEVARAEGISDKGVFIKELEMALEAGEIDLAVHSLKDVPTVLEAHFAIATVLERAPIRDVLVSRGPGGLNGLPNDARVATGSVRRQRQLSFLRPDLDVVDLRGNVPTRLRKLLDEDGPDAIMLAEAGLVRLGHDLSKGIEIDGEILHVAVLDEAVFYPAAGQGAIGIEVRAGDAATAAMVRRIGHAETLARVTAEREFLRLMDAGCHTPVGVFSEVSGERLRLCARVFDEMDMTLEPVEAAAEWLLADPLGAGKKLYDALG